MTEEELWALPRTKKGAQSLGLNRFFSGVPCKREHLVERDQYGVCVSCRAAAAKALKSSPEFKARQGVYLRERYANDEDYRERLRTLAREEYASNEEYRNRKITQAKGRYASKKAELEKLSRK